MKLFESLQASWNVASRARGIRELAGAILPLSMVKKVVLNEGGDDAQGGDLAAEELWRLGNRLKAEALVGEEGADYAGLKGSELVDELRRLAARLKDFDPGQLEDDHCRGAFWINLYNLLMIHGVIELEIERSVMEVPGFFRSVGYEVGGYFMTPDGIEHGILRRNRAHPFTGSPVYREEDPRLAWCVEAMDRRIHFALVCVARSCPPIAFYESARLNEQLELAAEGFVNGSVLVDDEAQTVRISEIFRFYRDDFGGDQGVREFVIDTSDATLSVQLKDGMDQGFRWKYETYDWSLNAL